MQSQSAAGGSAGFLQDKRVQIGLIAGGAVVILAAVFFFLIRPSLSGSGSAGTAVATANGPGTTIGGNGPAVGAGPTAVGSTAAVPAATTPGAAPAAGAAAGGAAAGSKEKSAPKGPGVSTRANPFQPNRELKAVMATIPPPPTGPTVIAEAHDLYTELNPPKPEVQVTSNETNDGPPVPPMRLTGVVEGAQVSALIQIGSGSNAIFAQATPGKMIPEQNPVFRVERIENDKVFLTRRWEMGGRKGVQHLEVDLAGDPGAARGFAGAGSFGSPAGVPVSAPSGPV